MSAASNFLEDKLLDHTLRYSTAPYTAPTTVYVALFADSGSGASAALESGTSSTTGTSNWGYYEISNGSYARQTIAFTAAGTPGGNTTGTITSSGTVSFPVATADYDSDGGTGNVVTHIALMDDITGGNVLFYGTLTTSKTVSSGDQFTVSSGNLSISLA
jgi:hypothetical protein